MSLETPWMDWMRSHVGEIEQTGAPATDFDKEVFSHTSYGPLHGVMDAGCAATACAALEESGFQSPHNASAISFKNYGTPCALMPGCIVVIEHANGGHHVTFCEALIDPPAVVDCLGGNQGHKLCVKRFNFSDDGDKIIATRWPIKKVGNVA